MNELHGHELRQAFEAATRCLEQYRDTINALNVFPVPDGDTGTNMLLTMRSAMEQSAPAHTTAVAAIAAGMADGAFWGARGNSGVILSQFFKGFAEGLRDNETCGGADLARAFNLATELAYKSVGNPVEGTMLTVIRSLSLAAQEKLDQSDDDTRSLWETAFLASREALHRTPSQLPVLQEAGVVDAGGMGIVVILGGALGHLTGQDEDQIDLGMEGPLYTLQAPVSVPNIDSDYLSTTEEALWGYCTQFLIEGQDLDLEQIRERFTAMNDSAVVVGDDRYVRVHIHALDPGPALSYGVSLGEMSQIKLENMNQQNREFVSGHRARQEGPALAVVAVAPGEGLARLFRENGCAAVVSGGQTMNPSTLQLLEAAQVAGAGDVIILPNNKNIVAAAEQVAGVENGRLHVVPSCTVPQGVAALLAFNPEEPLEQNLKAMREVLGTVTTVEVTQAVRATTVGGVKVSTGQYLGLLEEQLAAAGESPEMALWSALAQAGLSNDQVVTVYWGADTSQEQAEAVRHALEEQTPGIQVDLVYGGQPHYHYLASVE